MTKKLAVVMDHISTIKPYKDSTFAMLLEAQTRGYELHHVTMDQLAFSDNQAIALNQKLTVTDNLDDWFQLEAVTTTPLTDFDVILMRKDPPFDMEYIYATYLLEHAQQQGTVIVNHPQSLRDANEKMYTTWFPECCPPLLISRQASQIKAFLEQYKDTVIKPLGGMGGESIFHLKAGDGNTNVILETLTEHGKTFAMVQKFVPEISAGDKRILLINGEPIPYALARIPADGEFRGNIAAGGRGVGQPLTERDYWICEQVGPTLKEKGLIFVGIDVIGDYLTEINVTSPTCIRELDKQFDLNISGTLFNAIEHS
ncbi:MAG: glutathione synthase [Methylococcales bacterium]|jgi:glutathione synthase|nr:glutathione synthase [Methylococcales bacterium]MBT7444613.1 glutathione synthase [Methylococcales bacterium]